MQLQADLPCQGFHGPRNRLLAPLARAPKSATAPLSVPPCGIGDSLVPHPPLSLKSDLVPVPQAVGDCPVQGLLGDLEVQEYLAAMVGFMGEGVAKEGQRT